MFTRTKSFLASLAVLTSMFFSINSNAGPVGGSQRGTDRVWAYDSEFYTVNIRGGEATQVAIIGDHDTDLDLFIYDEDGNLVASDEDGTDTCYAAVTARFGTKIIIEVRNLGRVYNDFEISVW